MGKNPNGLFLPFFLDAHWDVQDQLLVPHKTGGPPDGDQYQEKSAGCFHLLSRPPKAHIPTGVWGKWEHRPEWNFLNQQVKSPAFVGTILSSFHHASWTGIQSSEINPLRILKPL